MSAYRSHIVAILCSLLVALTAFGPCDAQAAKTAKGQNPKYAALVMEMDTGKVIYSRYADKVLHPASLTKIMTLMMAFDAMDRGTLRKSDRIVFSRHAAAASPTKMGIRVGGSMKVDDIIKSIVTKSANDSATALGEHLSGSESAFARAMTAKARSIGMKDTTFKNASGLPDPGQVTTAHDMALLARYLIKNYPEYYPYFSTVNFSYNGVNHHNHNRLLDKYAGMDGIKTGFINASGYNLVASAKRGNTRLIGVVFGGRSWQSRNAHMVELLDNGFAEVRAKGIMNVASLGYIRLPGESAGAAAELQLAAADRGTDRVTDRVTAGALVPNPKPAQLINASYTTSGQQAASYEPANAPLNWRDRKSDKQAVAHRQMQSRDVPVIRPDAAAAQASGAVLSDTVTTGLAAPSATVGSASWAIQIGAFQSRAATDLALETAKKRLPSHMENVEAEIVPYRTAQAEWIFRARLRGFNENDAQSACRYFADCLTISPGAY